MFLDLTSLVLAASLASGAPSIPRQDPDILSARQDTGDPGLQDIPTSAKPDNTFSNGAAMTASWPASDATPPSVYGNRTMDLPFGRLYVRNHQPPYSLSCTRSRAIRQSNGLVSYRDIPKLVVPSPSGNTDSDIVLQHGNMKFFPAGQLNTPTGDTDEWTPQGTDSATQSACGIPDNAFSISKVAIHPYFLKYADLSRKSPDRMSKMRQRMTLDDQVTACKMCAFRSGTKTALRT